MCSFEQRRDSVRVSVFGELSSKLGTQPRSVWVPCLVGGGSAVNSSSGAGGGDKSAVSH